MDDTKKLFGLRIKELRKARNWTQDYLAEQLGMETQNVSRMEKGVHMPNTAKIEALARLFNVEIYELFMFEHFIKIIAIKNITVSIILLGIFSAILTVVPVSKS